MLKGKKEKVKLAKKDPHKEELYEDDFEYFDYNDDDDDDDILKKLGIDNEVGFIKVPREKKKKSIKTFFISS